MGRLLSLSLFLAEASWAHPLIRLSFLSTVLDVHRALSGSNLLEKSIRLANTVTHAYDFGTRESEEELLQV